MTESNVEFSPETILDVVKTGRIKVLHVDDDPVFLKVAKQCLETQGEIDVDTASSVSEAWEKLNKGDEPSKRKLKEILTDIANSSKEVANINLQAT